jgi:putative transposase
MRTDNDVPFASARALYGLSKLAVWWLRLGIDIERITPGQQDDSRSTRAVRAPRRDRARVSSFVRCSVVNISRVDGMRDRTLCTS